MNYEIVGVRSLHWARDTRSPRTEVIAEFSAPRRLLAADTARFLSGEGNDDGMVDFWPAVGGGVMVRENGMPVAFYVGGHKGTADWPPFADMGTEPDPDYLSPASVPVMTGTQLADALTSGLLTVPADYRTAVLAEAARRLTGKTTDKTWVTVRRQDLADALRDPKFGTPEMERLTDAILYGTDERGNILPH